MFGEDYIDEIDCETNEEWRYWEPPDPDPKGQIQELLFPILGAHVERGGDFEATIRCKTDDYGIFTYVTLEVNGERQHAWEFAEEQSVKECIEWPFDHTEDLHL